MNIQEIHRVVVGRFCIQKFYYKKVVFGAFFILLLSLVLSFAQTGAKYLVVSHDNFIQAIHPLVEWKTKKGIPAVCVPLSVTGNTPAQIKSYIQNAYNTWTPRPEFILLVGSPDLLPSYDYVTDDYYANISGNYRIELSVGRFHCQTLAQCSLMVAKTIGYEKAIARQDTTWFCKGTTLIAEDYPPDAFYQPDCRYIRNLWLGAAYSHVDSFIDLQGHNQNDVINAINDGRTFVVYRGRAGGYWPNPFDVDPDQTNNGYKLPIVVSGTCATMTLSPGENLLGDDFLRAGTVQYPMGAVGFFGTTDLGSSVSGYRSAVTKGFFRALYQDSIFTMGEAAKRAKFIMDSLLPNQIRYQEWNLLGDPELNVWTKKPKSLTVFHDTFVFLNQPTNYRVWVGYANSPVSKALVCTMMDSTVYVHSYTDTTGWATLSFIPRNLGRMEVTVTAHNFFPYEGFANVNIGNAPHLLFHHQAISDSPPAGNGDSIVNPGEMINLLVYLINSGTVTACSVTARLNTTSQFVTVSDSIASFGDIPPGNIVGAINPFRFSVAPNCTNHHIIDCNLLITDTSIYNWFGRFSISVAAGKLEFYSCRVNDSVPLGNGNGYFSSGENIKLNLTLTNSGMGNLLEVVVKIKTDNSNIAITDSIGNFGRINAGTRESNTFDPFTIAVSPSLPAYQPVQFEVLAWEQGGTYIHTEMLDFTLHSDPGISSDPTGPDSYGYYCYDDIDFGSGRAPTFDWYEIAPPGPGTIISRISNAIDALDTLLSPFTCHYYGQLWGWITVSSNGFITMGRTNYRSGNNLPIPDPTGPMSVIAPFWDNLNTYNGHGGYGDIYQYYDTSNNRLIFEFKDVAHDGRDTVRETFQIILLDPDYYPTPTGDGDIIFQYQTVTDATSNTVGIESYTRTTGIQCVYNNICTLTSARLANSRALRFTTLAPAANLPWLYPVSMTISDSVGGNNNHIPEPGEGIQLVITLTNHGIIQAEDVQGLIRNIDGNAHVIDSLSDFGTILPQGQSNNANHPYFFEINVAISDTILDYNLVLSANGYNTTHYFAINVHGLPGITDARQKYMLNPAKLDCSPNPFSNQALIRWNVPPESPGIKLKIYDAAGRLVTSYRSLATNNCLVWHGKNNNGRRLGSGVYFMTISYKIASGEKVLVRKITISR